MKLMRLGPAGHERPVVRVDEGHYVDVSDVVPDFDERFFGATATGGGMLRLEQVVAERIAAGAVHPFVGADGAVERVGAPIARPHQILCIGLNYSDHAAESGMAVPDEPILFTKSPNTLVGPDDDVIMPRGATKLDWEVELGIVIGARTSYLDSPEQAKKHIAGYVVVNDVSERAFQIERGGQWAKGKSAETFNPAGPWLATPDELDDVMQLGMWLDVNGQRRQTGSTATMIFDPFVIVHYLSQFLVLEPGDLINTGTPPGVGLGMTPPTYLQVGDVMTLGIDGLGEQRQRVAPPR
ncbi:MAG: ureidoglycolate lyase [Micrococcales bacterium 32-70-13]|nr:MAG: ureidoglycolate lyase [Micrococcales bacterium 32-70-13]